MPFVSVLVLKNNNNNQVLWIFHYYYLLTLNKGVCLTTLQMEERLRKKRNKILHTKTGSATPMKVTFNK